MGLSSGVNGFFLGNFGATLGLRLVEDGHEMIGVDKRPDPVNLLQDSDRLVLFGKTQQIQDMPEAFEEY